MLHRLAHIGLALAIPGALLLHLVDALPADIVGGVLVAIGVPLELLATALIVRARLAPDPPAPNAEAHHDAVARTNGRHRPTTTGG